MYIDVAVGYYVRVYDCDSGEHWTEGTPVLHEQEFLISDQGSLLSQDVADNMALRKAEMHAIRLEDHVYPDKYVEVNAIWKKVVP